MRIRSLYTKFFLFFITGSVLSMVLVFGLFHALFFDRAMRKMGGFASAVSTSLGRLFALEVRHTPPESLGRRLDLLTGDLAARFGGKMWVTDDTGRVVSRSFSGGTPRISGPAMPMVSPFHVQQAYRKGHPAYFRQPFEVSTGKDWAYHLLFDTSIFRELSWFFALGLGVIVLLGALVLFPMYRHTAGPLRKLREAAGKIAAGDLSARSRVRGRDEVRELGMVFDGMAEYLERYVRATRELAANISHELRTPLARMRLASELLDGESRHKATIEREIAVMDGLIGRILELSRLDLQSRPGSSREVDLAALCRETAAAFTALAAERGMELRLTLPAGMATLLGDAETLARGLSALLENCITHGTPGRPVELSLARAPAGGLRLELVNEYAGMVPDDPTLLLEPFRKGATSTGSGLGLSIAERAFRINRGRIAIGAESGVFTITVAF